MKIFQLIEHEKGSVTKLVTQEHLYWEFIQSMNLSKEYRLFHLALVNKGIHVND